MKNFFCASLLFLGVLVFSYPEGIAEEAAAGEERTGMSYAFGMAVGSDMKQSGLKFNYNAFLRGFREMMEDQPTRFTLDEAVDLVQTAFRAVRAEQAEYNRLREEEFLAENAKRPGVITTPSGLQYEVLEEGTGPAPEITDFVRVHYQGAFLDGSVFDSSYDRGEPDEFPLQEVIPGWSEGLLLIKTGGKNRLYIPSKLAYGAQGAGSGIPPYATLIFEVELLDVVEPPSEDFFKPGEAEFELF